MRARSLSPAPSPPPSGRRSATLPSESCFTLRHRRREGGQIEEEGGTSDNLESKRNVTANPPKGCDRGESSQNTEDIGYNIPLF